MTADNSHAEVEVKLNAEVPAFLGRALDLYVAASGRKKKDVVADALRALLGDELLAAVRANMEGGDVPIPIPASARQQ